MQIPYPKSFLTLLLIGFSLVAVPFLFAFANAALYLDNITRQSRVAVTQAARTTQDSRTLIEQLTQMERVTRQYLVIGDTALLDRYVEAHRQFDQTARALGALLTDREQQEALAALTKKVDTIGAELALHGTTAPRTLPQEFTPLFSLANDILAASNHMIDRETAALQSAAEGAQRALMWQALSLIPFTLLATAGIAYLIARPLRQIDQAIHNLGSGRISEKISVSGPEDLEKLGERLDWLRLQLNEMEAQKNRFLREVSHELKTPLTAIREGTGLLQEGIAGHLSPQQQEIATILHDNSFRLQRMIEDLLHYSAVRFQTAPVMEKVALHEVLRQALAHHALPISSRSIRLITSLGRVSLTGDRNKLATLMDNLLSNAVKFTPREGTIKVLLRASNGEALIDVLNSGAGVAAADRPHLFEPFYQGQASQPEGYVKGSGLGLSIAMDCAQAHHGSIEIMDDETWQGAHFRVRLPLDIPGAENETG